MNTNLKVAAFVLVVVGLIAGFATQIPQVESPAPQQLQITGELSGPELAQVGQQIFESPEGGCQACHAIGRPGLRAPDLAGVGLRAATRVAGKSAEDYLRESLVTPCTYVVEGYDCIMPQTFLQTLGPAKVTALIAFLESQGGEITVKLSAADLSGTPAAPPAVGLPGVTAEEIMPAAGCPACHTIAAIGANGQVGPDLSKIGARRTPDELRQSILDPQAVIAEDCPQPGGAGPGACPENIMPKDFGKKLSAAQLETIVVFLSNLK